MFDKRKHIYVGFIAKRALDGKIIDMKFEMVLAFCISVEVLLLAEEARNDSRLLDMLNGFQLRLDNDINLKTNIFFIESIGLGFS